MDWVTVRRQGGVFSRRQARSWGVSDRQLDRRLASGLLLAAPRGRAGVLVAAGTPWTHQASLWTALLSIGEPSALMGETAAGVYRWCEASELIWVAVPRQRAVVRLPGTRVVRLQLEASDLTVLSGLPVTTKPRTVADCLRFLPLGRASDVLDRSQQRDAVDVVDIAKSLSARGRGTRQARRLLAAVDGSVFAAERLMAHVLRRAGLLGWAPNHRLVIDGRPVVIDFAFVAQKLAVEVDGFAFHSDVDRFRDDRARQNALVNAGWLVLRFTWHDLVDDPDRVVGEIEAALATRSPHSR